MTNINIYLLVGAPAILLSLFKMALKYKWFQRSWVWSKQKWSAYVYQRELILERAKKAVQREDEVIRQQKEKDHLRETMVVELNSLQGLECLIVVHAAKSPKQEIRTDRFDFRHTFPSAYAEEFGLKWYATVTDLARRGILRQHRNIKLVQRADKSIMHHAVYVLDSDYYTLLMQNNVDTHFSSTFSRVLESINFGSTFILYNLERQANEWQQKLQEHLDEEYKN